jgi:hypothetical protein
LKGRSNEVANSFNDKWREKHTRGVLFITEFHILYQTLAEEKSKKTE